MDSPVVREDIIGVLEAKFFALLHLTQDVECLQNGLSDIRVDFRVV
jgi:hypothetical protein